MPRIRFILFLTIVMLLSMGCNLLNLLPSSDSSQPGGNQPPQVATLINKPTLVDLPTEIVPSKTDELNSDVLIEDDFSDPASGWEVYADEYGSTSYTAGGYQVEAVQENEYMWGVRGVKYSDIRIDVDATVLQTVTDAYDAFGIDCRLQSNADGYGFRITSDGWVTISKYADAESIPLVDWLESSAIRTDGSTNHLTVVCAGNSLQLFVNDELVAEARDDAFASGDIGLAVIPFNPGTVTVLFDNLVVQKADAR